MTLPDSGGKNHDAFSPYSGTSCSHKLTISLISSVKPLLGIFGISIIHSPLILLSKPLNWALSYKVHFTFNIMHPLFLIVNDC